MHEGMIDYLRNNHGLMVRHSRSEVRDFLERLDSDGYLIDCKPVVPAPQPVVAESAAVEQPAPVEVPAEEIKAADAD